MKSLGTVNQNQDKQGKTTKFIVTWSFFSEKTVVIYKDNVYNTSAWF